VDIAESKLPYKLLVLPGLAVMDEAAAVRIRDYVRGGGTVVMTGYSAVLNESGQAFTTTHPGKLDDVFGIRIGGFEESALMNELSKVGTTGPQLRINFGGHDFTTESPRFDLIEPKGAVVLGRIAGLDRDYPVVTQHGYGKGQAIYVGIPAREDLLDAVLSPLMRELGITAGPEVPKGVMARRIDARHILYLNLEGTDKSVTLPGPSRSILYNRDYQQGFVLKPFEPEFVEVP